MAALITTAGRFSELVTGRPMRIWIVKVSGGCVVLTGFCLVLSVDCAVLVGVCAVLVGGCAVLFGVCVVLLTCCLLLVLNVEVCDSGMDVGVRALAEVDVGEEVVVTSIWLTFSDSLNVSGPKNESERLNLDVPVTGKVMNSRASYFITHSYVDKLVALHEIPLSVALFLLLTADLN